MTLFTSTQKSKIRTLSKYFSSLFHPYGTDISPMNEYLHTKVSIPGANVSGYLRYVGAIDGKQGSFCGVELIGPLASSRGKNSGEVDGKEYFKVQHPHTGLFLPYSRLLKANPHLERPVSRSPSLVSQTPSPSAKHRFPSNIRSASPALSKRTIAERSTSLPSAAIGNASEFTKLRKDYDDLKRTHEMTKRDMDDKLRILEELQQTVSELQPVLEEYEYDLAEKDKRFQRQKLEFEKARDQWRQSLDVVVSNQQESEDFYEKRIEDLESRLSSSKSNVSDDAHTIIKNLETTISQLTDENGRLKAHMESGSNLVPVNQDELDRSQKYIATLEGEVEQLLAKVAQMEENTQYSKTRLVENLGSMSIDESSTDKDKLIQRLQHELEMRPTFDELSDLQKSLDELDELHATELEKKRQEISQLKDRVNTLEKFKSSPLATNTVASDLTSLLPLPEPSIELTPEDDLPIYKPATPTDPSAGREDWCGLCERSGHSSIDCPYENDMF